MGILVCNKYGEIIILRGKYCAMFVLEILLCWLIADVISGIVHWFEDTWLSYGNAFLDDLVVGPNIDHHRNPGGIVDGTYWQKNRIGIILSILVTVLLVLTGIRDWHYYLVTAFSSQLNQVHVWTHTSKPPWLVKTFQSIGLLQSVVHHSLHHKKPYAVHYCTTTNWLNPIFETLKVWRGLEWLGERLGFTVMRGSSQRDLF